MSFEKKEWRKDSGIFSGILAEEVRGRICAHGFGNGKQLKGSFVIYTKHMQYNRISSHF